MKNKDTRGGKNRLVTKNPFTQQSEQTDYWVGYIAADGFVSSKKYLIGVKSKDILHLEKYKEYIGENVKLRTEVNKAGNTIGIVNFGNFEAYYYLISLGITPQKSKTFKYSTLLNGNILRGHFDGDGSISQNRPKITTGSDLFKEQLCSYYRSLGIKYSVSRKSESTWDIYVLKDSRKKLYDLMYSNASIFLDRKRAKFAAIVGDNYMKTPNIGGSLEADNPDTQTGNSKVLTTTKENL